ncbi:MAG TPA: cell envelope integrity EipB family protein [Microvirga sp.]|jgi:hypothetical protein|nr:cell envelope integrity EipB family protein [Microvirga sp.]
MRLAPLALSAILLAAAFPARAAEGGAPVQLVPHRAVYDLSLLRSQGSQGVEGARGRIAFDFGGDACEGYTLKYRQVTVLESNESGPRTLDVRTATFESGDGRSMRFKTDSTLQGLPDDNVDGEAKAEAGGIAVRLKTPKAEAFSLPGAAVFPSEHLKRLIRAAQAGETSLAIKLFDGSDDGKKVYDTYAVIGRRIEPGAGANLEGAAKQEAVSKLARWPVSVSYYKAGAGDQVPVYAISFELYENGISRALRLDYGDFVLKGEMQSLEVLPASACQK